MKPAIKSGMQLYEIYNAIAEIHAQFNEQLKQEIKTEITTTFRAVPLPDFFKALSYFKVPYYELRTPQGELLGYCFHYQPHEHLTFTIASELLNQNFLKPALINYQ